MAAAAAASPGSPDWVVLRDGCLRCDEEGLRSLSYHPALNAILAVTSRGSIKVIDGTSGAILQASALHGEFRFVRVLRDLSRPTWILSQLNPGLDLLIEEAYGRSFPRIARDGGGECQNVRLVFDGAVLRE